MVENDTPIYVKNTKIENVESNIYLGYGNRKKTKRRRFKEESRPDGSIRQAPRHLQG